MGTQNQPKSKAFTAKYNVNKLVYFEEFEDREEARAREVYIKKKTFNWKCDLIIRVNPSWIELDPSQTMSTQLY